MATIDDAIVTISMSVDMDRSFCWNLDVAGFDVENQDQVVYRDSFKLRVTTYGDLVTNVTWAFAHIWCHVTPTTINGGPCDRDHLAAQFIDYAWSNMALNQLDHAARRQRHILGMMGMSLERMN